MMLSCLFLILFSLQSLFFSLNWTNGYSYHKTITIDRTKAGASDSTNFPMLVRGTYSYLATIANGGNVKSSSGYDVVFTSDAGCSSLLSWEQESWSASSGAVIYWVKIPNLNSTADGSNTVIYLCYGNPSIASFQGGAKGAAWSSAFVGVYHLGDGSSLSAVDSAAGGNDGTLAGSPLPGAVSGEIDGGAGLTAANSDYITLANPSSFNFGASFTVSFWINTTQTSVGTILSKTAAGSWHAGGKFIYVATHVTLAAYGMATCSGYSANVYNGAWRHVVVVYATSPSFSETYYVDGTASLTPGSGDCGADTSGDVVIIGQLANSDYLNGSLDELRFASTNRSADWIKAEYNNQSSPSTFYSGL